MYRSQKNIQNQRLDYKALYLQEKKLKEQFLKRAQLAELKYRKLAQSVNKKCLRCMNIQSPTNKQNQIIQLKKFTNGLRLPKFGPLHSIYQKQVHEKQKMITNFAVFGLPQSILIQSYQSQEFIEGEMIYVSQIPSLVEEHAAKLSFPSGIIPQYFTGNDAKEKAIKIMNSNYSNAKCFIMSFQSNKNSSNIQCPLKLIMNPQNKIYAICLSVEDFSLVPNWNTEMVESAKIVGQKKVELSTKVSYESTDISFHHQIECSIAVSQRIYCIFSQYPFFTFYQELLREIVNTVKTERLVKYRQSGSALAEVDSHFCLEKVKQTYKQISVQMEHWQLKINRQQKLQMPNRKNIQLSLYPEECSFNFVQEWGLSIINLFKFDPFLDVFTLIMLQQKVIFVSENPSMVTLAVHLFTQILPRPFQYPFPVINMLPQNDGYFSTPCPFVYGALYSRKTIKKISETNSHIIFILLQKQGAQILCSECKKQIVKKRSKTLRQTLSIKFKGNNQRRDKNSNPIFIDEEINFSKDRQGICLDIIKSVNLYLTEQVLAKLPHISEVNNLLQNLEVSALKHGQDLHQMVFQKIKKQCIAKSKDQFFHSLLDTQIINTYLFR